MSSNGDDTTRSSSGMASLVALTQREKPFVFSLVQGPGSPRDYVLGSADMVVGRSDAADIQVPSEEVSRKHLLVRNIGSEHTCVDLGSRNGFYLNGVKVHSATLRAMSKSPKALLSSGRLPTGVVLVCALASLSHTSGWLPQG